MHSPQPLIDVEQDARMNQLVEHIVATVQAIRNHEYGWSLMFGTSFVCVFNTVNFLTSPSFTANLGLSLSLATLLYHWYLTWRQHQQRHLARALTDALELREAQKDIIQGLKSDLALALERDHQREVEHHKLQFDVTQLSAELLRAKGHLAQSSKRTPLRSPSPLHSQVEVLLVEDQAEVRLSVTRILSYFGFKVSTAENVLQAMDLIRGRLEHGPSFDYAILDVQLPDGSGLDVLRMLHQEKSTTVSIVVSGVLDEELVEQAKRLNASVTLCKPIDLDQLLILLGFQDAFQNA